MDFGEGIMTLVFIGDSVTDCDRMDFPPYGNGWVSHIAKSSRVKEEIINVGISGNRLIDLVKRWESDVLNNNPTLLSVAIGINDTWRRYDDNDPTSVKDFEDNYRNILDQVKEKSNPRIILCEPFLLPAKPEMLLWREDLDPKINVVKKLAVDYDAIFVPFDSFLNKLAQERSIGEVAGDGIHPTEFGHQAMANLWLEKVMPQAQQ